MGDVISLAARQLKAAAPPQPAASASAQILFFTGVRYERMSDAAAIGPARPSSRGGGDGKRRRKRG